MMNVENAIRNCFGTNENYDGYLFEQYEQLFYCYGDAFEELLFSVDELKNITLSFENVKKETDDFLNEAISLNELNLEDKDLMFKCVTKWVQVPFVSQLCQCLVDYLSSDIDDDELKDVEKQNLLLKGFDEKMNEFIERKLIDENESDSLKKYIVAMFAEIK